MSLERTSPCRIASLALLLVTGCDRSPQAESGMAQGSATVLHAVGAARSAATPVDASRKRAICMGAQCSAREDRGTERLKFNVALFADMPYGAKGKQQFPYLIKHVNAADVAFSIFLGDLKSGGGGPCTDENLYFPALRNFGEFIRPLIFLPGDNDWTDCWGLYGPSTVAPGADDPLERLQHERVLFASTPYSLGQTTLRLQRQSDQTGEFAENVRWSYGPVVFIGLNVQGSNDNYPYAGVAGETRPQYEIDRMREESRTRRTANLSWLRQGFDYARETGAEGVLVAWQADPNFNNDNDIDDTRLWDALPPYVAALNDAASHFSGQVVLAHGDTHYFRVDKPLKSPGGGTLSNFTRVEVFGAGDTHWVNVAIQPGSPELFRFEPRIVPENAE